MPAEKALTIPVLKFVRGFLALQGPPEEDPARMVEQELRGDVVHELRGLASE
jgi:hypothetical protein